MTKPKPKKKPNQLKKAIPRFGKVTIYNTMHSRVTSWHELEQDGEKKQQLSLLAKELAVANEAHHRAVKLMDVLATAEYQPPKKATSGELKFEHSRQVWIKSKFQHIYLAAYPAQVLETLFVDKTIEGRVVLSVGKPDENGSMTPRIVVPKIHIAGTKQEVPSSTGTEEEAPAAPVPAG